MTQEKLAKPEDLAGLLTSWGERNLGETDKKDLTDRFDMVDHAATAHRRLREVQMNGVEESEPINGGKISLKTSWSTSLGDAKKGFNAFLSNLPLISKKSFRSIPVLGKKEQERIRGVCVITDVERNKSDAGSLDFEPCGSGGKRLSQLRLLAYCFTAEC